MPFDHTQSQVYFREKFVPFAEANVSVLSRAFMYGLYLFTGIRANHNPETKSLHLFRLSAHYRRFLDSCRMLRFCRFPKLYTEERFTSVIIETIQKNNIQQDIYIRPFAFADNDHMGPALCDDSFGVVLFALGDYIPDTNLRCCVSSYRRTKDNAVSPRIKVGGAYVNTALVKHEATSRGFDEGIILDEHDKVVEGSAENIFLIRNKTLLTPPISSDILEGINRDSIITLARAEGYQVIEREIARQELYSADEIFLTGTAARLAIVSQIDDLTVGNGSYPISTELQKKYKALTYGSDPRYTHWLTTLPTT